MTRPNPRRRSTFAAIALILTAASSVAAAPPNVRLVRSDTSPGGDGLTWGTAYNDLRQALLTAAASGGSITELWVRQGTYFPAPAGSDDRTMTFTLASGVGVYGGFGGFELERSQRDPLSRITTLSGVTSAFKVTNVVLGAGNATAILDGFTITNGAAYEATTTGRGRAGGGIHVTGNPTIRNCIIRANTTGGSLADTGRHMGGGVYCAPGSAPTFISCTFSSNVTGSSVRSPGYSGAGLAAENAAVHLIGCDFIDNVAGGSSYGLCALGSPSSTGASGNGGGIYSLNSTLLLESCLLESNRSGQGGEGVVCALGASPGLNGGDGAGLYAESSTLVAFNCIFTRNQTGDGGVGAIWLVLSQPGGDGGIGGGLYTVGGNVDLVNCTIADNAVGVGGLGGGGSTLLQGEDGYATSIRADSSALLENCISWNDGLDEVVGAAAAYSNIRGGYSGPGVITADPQFIDAASGNYRVRETSPCIDAGNSFPAAGELPATDADGFSRREDIASVADTGIGPPVVDMGPYEIQACPVDLNGDGLVDFADYLEFLNLFDAGDIRVDFTGDGLVDFSDYLEFLNLFDAGC